MILSVAQFLTSYKCNLTVNREENDNAIILFCRRKYKITSLIITNSVTTMKKKLLFIVSALVYGLVLVSCGGNSVPKNEYLGTLPSIYAAYQADKEAYKNKVQEEAMSLLAGGKQNVAKIKTLADEEKQKLKEMKEQFDKDVRTETKNLAGREIPISYSESLKSSDEQFYSIAPVVLAKSDKGDLAMQIKIIAKNDIEFPKGLHFAYFRFVAADGSTLDPASIYLIDRNANDRSFAANVLIKEASYDMSIIQNEPALWANFAGIEFCTKEEFLTVSK